MAAARVASDKETDGVHDYPHGSKYQHYHDRGLLDGGPFVMLNDGTDGFQFVRQNGFEGCPETATPPCLSPQQRTRLKYQLLLVVTPKPRQPVDLETFLHPIAEELRTCEGYSGLYRPNFPESRRITGRNTQFYDGPTKRRQNLRV